MNFLVTVSSSQDDQFKNQIPDPEAPLPTEDEKNLVAINEVGLRESPNQDGDHLSNVLMTHAGDEGLFHNKEVLAGEEMLLILFALVFNEQNNIIGPMLI